MNQEQFSKYDSEFCGSVPIHLINVIQPYGVLLVVDINSLSIIQVSENTFPLFGVSAINMVEKKLSEFISDKEITELKTHLSEGVTEKLPLLWELNGERYTLIAHRKNNCFILEIENLPSGGGEDAHFVRVFRKIKNAMSNIEAAVSTEAACTVAAAELKKVSGFDKVMIYRFDEDWNGHVLAEAMEEGMESYIGFTFPASDIPKQARDLYLSNPYRYIPNREYAPVRLYPVINPATATFIDLSDCNIRGVSKVHLEYLGNMRVNASMSTRILFNGKLWGLIACHHRTARTMNYTMCAVFELLSGIISNKITSLYNRERLTKEEKVHQVYNTMVEALFKTGDVPGSLLFGAKTVLDLFSASGAILYFGNRSYSVGTVPPPEETDDLLLWLHTRKLRATLPVAALSVEYDRAELFQDIASGLLALPLNTQRDEYLLLFRPETVQTINWGGNPEERIFFEKDMRTYHPRYSFKLWQENVTGVSLPWEDVELNIAESLRSLIFQYNAENP
ncbi:GAF domain-containing protein [Parasegetibacter sp. NRK P23]|uniref:GAF domain-containing protein n=1 Tax=Parasegetibacter sp. NRK P23 TaxID=2942999 RepID=UPI0020440A51|nr:GAF domain-containing protein [Parasegetibacter sp. NRK P23]MCM5530052.1 GAF domain-containing protein [Parasegetibacter sp. NRK P23]